MNARRSEPADRLARRDRLLRSLLSLLVFLVVAGLALAWVTGQFSGSNGSGGASSGDPTPVALPASSSPSPAVTPTAHRHRRKHHPAPTASATPGPTTPAGDVFAGVTVGVDPGHNGGNFTHTSYIDHLIWNGREHEACNTTGTETDAGYTEAQYNFNVASYLVTDLEAAGAHVVLTRHSNSGVGPCVNKRAEIINASHAAVAVDIHADGGPASGRGFTVLEPVKDGINNRVVGLSEVYGADLRNAFEATGMPTSTYDGTNGINYRDNLAGLNLTTVPQVLIETGNMRNATDARLLTSPAFQRKAARAIMAGMATFLASEHR